MQKRLLRICSLLLAFELLVNMLPMSVFAKELQVSLSNAQTTTGSTETGNTLENPEAYIVDELVEKRTEFSKEFLLSNGLHVAAVYADAVHYETDSGWEEIDNTLKTNADGTLSNTAGVWDVSFPQQLTEDDSIIIEKDGYTLSFSMAGELTASGAALMTARLDEDEATVAPFSVTEVQTSNAQIQQIDTTAMEETIEYPEAVPDKVQSQVSYADVYENTDVVYDLNSNQVKESIILESYSEELHGYRYTLDVGTMIPVLEEDGQITFYDADQENVVLVMPAPYLVDNAGLRNDDIQVQLTGSGSSYTMLYILPQQWLAAEDRVWPVVLDPAVTPAITTQNIQDQTINEYQEKDYEWGFLQVGRSETFGISRAVVKFANLPQLTSSDVIVSASMQMMTPPGEGTIDNTVIEVHKITNDWESDSVHWLNDVEFDENIEDYAIVPKSYTVSEDSFAYWVVTDIVRDWYANKNTGMLFKASASAEALTGTNTAYKRFFSCNYSEQDVIQPYLMITFRNNNGAESYWDYTSASAGRAGTGHVNNFTGNLTWIRSDIGFDGSRMPVSISHIYNLNDAVVPTDTNNSNDSGGNSFGMGIGWRTNYNQLLYRWELDNEDKDYYIWEDEDGTDHYFELKDGKYQDEDGLELTLTVSGTGDSKYVISDKYGNTRHFDAEGKLKKIVDNQETKSEAVISYNSDGLISQIKDGANRVYHFAYDNQLLSSIRYTGKEEKTDTLAIVTFDYDDSNRLISVTSNDGQVCTYAYNENNLLTAATDIDGYSLRYSYDKEDGYASWQPYRVKQVCEYDGTAQGGELAFAYGHNQTVITDHNQEKKIIQFNDFGNPISIQDGEGRAQHCQYAFHTDDQKNTNTDITAKGNQLRAVSDLQYTTSSLLLDGGMFLTNETLSNRWTRYGDSSIEITTESAYADTRVMKVYSYLDEGENGARLNTVSIAAGETQTFSCFVKPKDTSVYLIAKCGSNTVVSEVEPVANAWRRMQITYTNKTATEQSVEYYVVSGELGYFYLDCAQLERAPIASRYNLINNGDFNCGTTYGWTQTHKGSNDGIYILDENTEAAAPQLDKTVYRMQGNAYSQRCLEQSVCIMGKAGDSLMLSGWAKGNSAPLDSYDDREREFALQCVLRYTDGTESEPFTARFNSDSDEWQYTATAISAEKDYRFVDIRLVYHYNVNTVYFDGIQLNKDEGSNTFVYDKDGNVLSAVNAQGKKTDYEYTDNDMTREILPTGVESTYDYDDYHNVTKATTQEGLEYTFAYDEYGNNTSVSISDGTKTMTSTAVYSNDGNYLESVTDASGNTTSYNYDTDKGTLQSVTSPHGEDETGAQTVYSYDNMFRLEKASLANGASEEDTLEAEYVYTQDQLTGISTKTTQYTFTYGNFGLRASVSAGERTLATYIYSDDKNNYLESLAYGNGDVVEYDHDGQGRVTKETYEDGDTVEYRYDTSGALATVYDSESGIISSYCYDLTDRLQKYLETGNNHSVFLLYTYNEDNLISRVRENINGYSRLSKYTYTEDNKLSIFQKAYGYRYYDYDGLGRVTETVTKDHDTTLLTTTYTYSGTDTAATGQIASIKNTAAGTDTPYDVTYSYTYDERGNITSVSDGTYETSYEYDLANQLIRENNQKTGKTWTWTYDAGGNITSRGEYAYTADDLGEAIKTVHYGYEIAEAPASQEATGDDAENSPKKWGDLLVSYDGATIEYDEIGNPEAIRGWSMEWQHGRELASMSKDGITWNHTYNADGLRTKRTNGTTTYTYIYVGGTLVRMTETVGNTTNRLFFSHSPEGLPLSVVYKGVEYYYVTNIQGDVVALLDIEGNVVVEYTYDAWGNVLTTTGSGAETIGRVNPLRYRGYVYDNETGLYYLQSRYYDPEIGRFINADCFTSTGQGILGNNMFVYCLNNPGNNCDPQGELAYPGEIHNAVVQRIHTLYGYETEQIIHYKDGGYGRADLISKDGQVWDVKRDKPKQIENGINQVKKYAANIWCKNPDIKLKVGMNSITSDSFYYKSGLTTYKVTYRYAEKGVIAYDYYISDFDEETFSATALTVVSVIFMGAMYYATGGLGFIAPI